MGLTTAAPAIDAAIHKKIFRSGRVAKVFDRARSSDLAKQTTIIISNEKMNDIMKIVKSLQKFGLLIEDVIETFQNEEKE